MQVRSDLNIFPTVKQPLYFFRNRSADFHHQPAAGFERGVGLRDEARDHLSSGVAGEDCVARLEFADFELHLVFFGLTNVGWVRYYEIERVCIQTLE